MLLYACFFITFSYVKILFLLVFKYPQSTKFIEQNLAHNINNIDGVIQ